MQHAKRAFAAFVTSLVLAVGAIAGAVPASAVTVSDYERISAEGECPLSQDIYDCIWEHHFLQIEVNNRNITWLKRELPKDQALYKQRRAYLEGLIAKQDAALKPYGTFQKLVARIKASSTLEMSANQKRLDARMTAISAAATHDKAKAVTAKAKKAVDAAKKKVKQARTKAAKKKAAAALKSANAKYTAEKQKSDARAKTRKSAEAKYSAAAKNYSKVVAASKAARAAKNELEARQVVIDNYYWYQFGDALAALDRTEDLISALTQRNRDLRERWS